MKSNANKQRFKIIPFLNPTGSESWRVSGCRRDGKQIRENFPALKAAQVRQMELTSEYLGSEIAVAVQATKLTREQILLAETAFLRLGADVDLLPAVEHWLKHGKGRAVAQSPRIDEAVKAFAAWLPSSNLRERTRSNLAMRVRMFANSVPNLKVADVTPETIDAFLDKRAVSAATRDNDRRAVSRFFSWCIDRKRKWATVNPCHTVKVEKAEAGEPETLTVAECAGLLDAARRHRGGCTLPYVAACLFGGLRPFEAARLQWSAVNLEDNEIRLTGMQTKTGAPRVIAVCPTLRAWLEACKGQPFFPANWRKDFDAVKAAIGYNGRTPKDGMKAWPVDVMRHTAISHYFRKTGSYGQTAEQFGNSEAIIKRHYQGRVTSAETEKFYGLKP